jgi:hypothetical protein
MFPCGEAPAAAGLGANYRNVASAARAAAAASAASGEMWDRFAARAVAGRAVVHDNDSAIDQNDGLAPAADMAVGRRSAAVVAVLDAAALIDNCAAVRKSSSATMEGNFSEAGARSSAAAWTDNFATGSWVQDETDSGAALQAGWILVAEDGSVLNDGGAPGGKVAAQDHFDDFARGTAPRLTPAS